MGNLGDYQWITTIAKKVGGPSVLIGIVLFLGFLLGPLVILVLILILIVRVILVLNKK